MKKQVNKLKVFDHNGDELGVLKSIDDDNSHIVIYKKLSRANGMSYAVKMERVKFHGNHIIVMPKGA